MPLHDTMCFFSISLLALIACGGRADESDRSTAQSVDVSRPSSCGVRFVDERHGSDALANDCRQRHLSCATIQHGVDAACSGDTVDIAAGEYRENVVVGKALTLAGAGRHTIVRPAVSNPNPCIADSLCGGAASNIVLVEASDVTIHDLVLDGDNPSLTSGVVRGGADVDARNGILTNHTKGVFENLVVRDVTVQNVYLRGIYASSGGSFRFEDDTVENVQGDAYSVAMFDFGGAGIIARSRVEDANDAISANHSRGVHFVENHVERSGSGVHSDNAGDTPGAAADRIERNVVRECTDGGYGIFVFVPHVATAVLRNDVRGCTIGLGAFGQGATVTTSFVDNRVHGTHAPGSVGVLVTTDKLGFGSSDVAASFDRNDVRGWGTAFDVVRSPGNSASATLACNRLQASGTGLRSASADVRLRDNVIAGNAVGVDATGVSSGIVDAKDNWWGCPAGPPAARCDDAVGNVDPSSSDAAIPECAERE